MRRGLAGRVGDLPRDRVPPRAGDRCDHRARRRAARSWRAGARLARIALHRCACSKPSPARGSRPSNFARGGESADARWSATARWACVRGTSCPRPAAPVAVRRAGRCMRCARSRPSSDPTRDRSPRPRTSPASTACWPRGCTGAPHAIAARWVGRSRAAPRGLPGALRDRRARSDARSSNSMRRCPAPCSRRGAGGRAARRSIEPPRLSAQRACAPSPFPPAPTPCRCRTPRGPSARRARGVLGTVAPAAGDHRRTARTGRARPNRRRSGSGYRGRVRTARASGGGDRRTPRRPRILGDPPEGEGGIDWIETRLRWAARLKGEIVRAGLGLALRTVESRAHRSIAAIPPAQAAELAAALLGALSEAADVFDASKGGRFAAPAGLALNRAVTRWLEAHAGHVAPGRALPRPDPALVRFDDPWPSLTAWNAWLELPGVARERIETLGGVERDVIVVRMGWDARPPRTVRQAAAELGVSTLLVQRAEKRAVNTLS